MRHGSGAMVAGAARGAIGAMAMSGMRQAATSLNLVRRTPPEALLLRAIPKLFNRVPPARRPVVVEAIHWSYGAGGGILFGLLPRRVRRHAWAGPAYGLAFWLGFELAKGPLRLHTGSGGRVQHVTLLADHVLYGITVSASEWPYRD